jgi:hypothetical protein
MTANDELDRSRRTRPVSLLIPTGSRPLDLVVEYLGSRDCIARPGNKAEASPNSAPGNPKGDHQ